MHEPFISNDTHHCTELYANFGLHISQWTNTTEMEQETHSVDYGIVVQLGFQDALRETLLSTPRSACGSSDTMQIACQ